MRMKGTFTPSLVVTNQYSLSIIQKFMLTFLTMLNHRLNGTISSSREEKILDEKAQADLQEYFQNMFKDNVEVVTTSSSDIYKVYGIYVLKMFQENDKTITLK